MQASSQERIFSSMVAGRRSSPLGLSAGPQSFFAAASPMSCSGSPSAGTGSIATRSLLLWYWEAEKASPAATLRAYHPSLTRQEFDSPSGAFAKFSNHRLDERLSRRSPRLHTIITEIRRARIHPWRALGKGNGFDKPPSGAMEPGPCQRVRTDFARKIFGKLFVGGFTSIRRLLPIPFNSRAGHFDNRRLRTIRGTPR
jgi:hypothetical protein